MLSVTNNREEKKKTPAQTSFSYASILIIFCSLKIAVKFSGLIQTFFLNLSFCESGIWAQFGLGPLPQSLS